MSDETTFVVEKTILTGFGDLEGVGAPDDELSFFVHLSAVGSQVCLVVLDCAPPPTPGAENRGRCADASRQSPLPGLTNKSG